MKQPVFTKRWWCLPAFLPMRGRLWMLDSPIYTDEFVAELAEECTNLIFFEELIDMGMTYDTETGAFEPVSEVRVTTSVDWTDEYVRELKRLEREADGDLIGD